MKIQSIQIKNHVQLKDVTLQFPEQALIALTGDNGAGKSSLLDCISCAIFGELPNRKGGVYTGFPGPDGSIDLSFEMSGHQYRIRRLIDGKGRKQKAFLFVDGQPVGEGKVSEFDALVSEHVGLDSQTFHATVSAVQTGEGNPLSLDERGKRSLLSNILGLRRFEEKHERVASAQRQLHTDIERLKIQRDAVLTTTETPEELEDQCAGLVAQRADIDAHAAQLVAELKALTEKEAVLKAGSANVQALMEAQSEYQGNIERLGASIKDLEERIRNNESLIEPTKAADIMRAAQRYREAELELKRLQDEKDALQAAIDTSRQAHQEAVNARQNELVTTQQRWKAAQQLVQAKEATVADACRQADNIEARIKVLKPQTETMERVPCTGTDLQTTCPLLAQARNAVSVIAESEAALAELAAQREIETASLLPLVADMDAAAEAFHQLEAELNAFRAETSWGSQAAELIGVNQTIAQQQQVLLESKPLAVLEEKMKVATERLESLRQELSEKMASRNQFEASLAEVSSKLAGFENEQQALGSVAMERQQREQELYQLTVKADALNQQVARLKLRIEQLKQQREQAAELTGQINALLAQDPLLSLLREGFGPKGAPALVMDAAGKAIAETANTLLRQCHGSRFTIDIRTQRELVTKDELRECLEIIVVDNESGSERNVADMSGGERAIISEVVSLALAIELRSRNGVKTSTLFRDECSAPLSEENTQVYLKMLKNAMRLGNYDQVVFVSHKKIAQQMADSHIRVFSGKAEVIKAV